MVEVWREAMSTILDGVLDGQARAGAGAGFGAALGDATASYISTGKVDLCTAALRGVGTGPLLLREILMPLQRADAVRHALAELV